MNVHDLYVRLSTHPVAEGAAAGVALLGALFAPIVLGYSAAVLAELGSTGAYATGVGSTLTGIWAFNRVLWRTRVQEWVAGLFEWTRATGITEGESA